MKPSMSNGERRRILSQIALGNIAPDTVIENVTVFNAFNKKIIENSPSGSNMDGSPMWVRITIQIGKTEPM